MRRSDSGRSGGIPRVRNLEACTLLAGLARETTRVRLGTLVTGMTYRIPSVLAAQVITVDHLSGGRVECAVGAAWNEPEHRELGITFPSPRERADRSEEGVQVMKLLFTKDDVTFEGRSAKDAEEEVRRTSDWLRDGGIGYLVVDWPGEGRGRVEEFIEQVMPTLA